MKKKNFTSMLLLLASVFASAQTTEWAGKFGGDGEDVVLAMHTDAGGNTYTTGYFTMDCDFNISEESYILSTDLYSKSFVQKTGPDGNFLWAKSIGGMTGDNGTNITTDTAGNVYVTGVFSETGDFDPGEGTANMTSAGELDIYIVKLSADGEYVWAKHFSGEAYEESNGIGVDESGNVYVSGYFYNAVDFDPGAGTSSLTPTGSGDGFIVKLKSDGSFIWAKKFGGAEFDLATGLHVTPDGNLYICGNFSETADFDPSEGTFSLSVMEQDSGIYLLHLDSNGAFVKAVKVGQAQNSAFAGPPAIDSTGAAYVTGYFGGDATFITTEGNVDMPVTDFYNAYIAKVNADGAVAWARPLQSDMLSLSYAVGVNSLDEVFVSGYFNGTLTLGGVSLTEDNASDSQSFVAKLSADGAFAWARQYGGINFVDRCAIAVDGEDNIYLSSAFDGTVDIDPEPENELEVTVTDFRDNFLIKMKDAVLSGPDHGSTTDVVLYPNPVKNFISITGSESLDGISYLIHDMAGRQVLGGILDTAQKINISSLQAGLYNVSIGGSAYKIVIE